MEFRVLGVLEALDDGPADLARGAEAAVGARRCCSSTPTGRSPPTVSSTASGVTSRRQRAAATLQVYVSNLRKALEPDRSPRAEPTVLLTQPPGYVLAVDPEQVDLFRFERLVSVARSLASHGCVAGAAVLFREALALWREAPLADLANEPFARVRGPAARGGAHRRDRRPDRRRPRARSRRRRRRARGARRPLPVPRAPPSTAHASRSTDPVGRPTRSAAYQAARHVLVEELGIEPGRELREIEGAILVQDPELVPDRARATGRRRRRARPRRRQRRRSRSDASSS